MVVSECCFLKQFPVPHSSVPLLGCQKNTFCPTFFIKTLICFRFDTKLLSDNQWTIWKNPSYQHFLKGLIMSWGYSSGHMCTNERIFTSEIITRGENHQWPHDSASSQSEYFFVILDIVTLNIGTYQSKTEVKLRLMSKHHKLMQAALLC